MRYLFLIGKENNSCMFTMCGVKRIKEEWIAELKENQHPFAFYDSVNGRLEFFFESEEQFKNRVIYKEDTVSKLIMKRNRGKFDNAKFIELQGKVFRKEDIEELKKCW